MLLRKVVFAISIATVLSVCNAYRILGVFPMNAKSHNILFQALMKGLAKKGHQVDVVSHFPLEKPHKNYNDIINLDGSMERIMNNFTFDYLQKYEGFLVDVHHLCESFGNRLCHFMGNKEMQNLIKNPPTDPPYDLVITELFGAHCYLGLGHAFKVPVVAISSAVEYPWISAFTGNNDNTAYVPNYSFTKFRNFNFWDRLKNTIIDYVVRTYFQYLTEQSQTESMRKYISPDIPSVREVERNIALILVNSHPVLYGVKPITPSLVQIAGLHIEGNNETLPSELKNWMDESSHGVVYFSLGSLILLESLPEDQLRGIFSSFEKIAPVRVLIKIYDSSKISFKIPENVKTLSWAPQQPILAHRNTKGFVTHGGLGSVQEALYYGIPMIGIPIFGDQFKNVAAAADNGMLFQIDIWQLSEATLSSAFKALLNDATYKENAIHYSKLFREQPISPLANAIYWIEYVIRNGGEPIRSPALEYTWWQLALLDVYVFILSVVIVSIAIILCTVKMIFHKLTMKSKHAKSLKKKTN